jgi:hypothetical protein
MPPDGSSFRQEVRKNTPKLRLPGPRERLIQPNEEVQVYERRRLHALVAPCRRDLLEVHDIDLFGELSHARPELPAPQPAVRAANSVETRSRPERFWQYLDRKITWGVLGSRPGTSRGQRGDLDAVGSQPSEQPDRAAGWCSSLHDGRLA